MKRNILHNIRILDFTWVLAGPYATRLLADFGAEVIKVQPPMPEEDTPFARAYYDAWNRNKLGITLDLNNPEGIDLAKKLAAISDAVIENFSPRVMANWGLDYESLRQIKPDIIMLSMSVFGRTGPYRDYAGFGPAVHAFSGMTHLTSFPGKPPAGPGFAYSDHAAGLYASLALMSALEYRHKTGEGQFIDLSQAEVMTGLLGEAVVESQISGKEITPAGNTLPYAAPHNVYPCLGNDRWCAIAVFTEEEWQDFKRATGNPAWAEDAAFSTLVNRLANREALDRLIGQWTCRHTPEEVMSIMQSKWICAGVVQNAADLINDPQLKERGFFAHPDYDDSRKSIIDTTPIKMSGKPASYRRAAPFPGRDNDYVYGDLLKLSKSEIRKLKRLGVIR